MNSFVAIAGKVIIYTLILNIVRLVIAKLISRENSNINNIGNNQDICIKKTDISIVFLVIAMGFTILFTIVAAFPSNVSGRTKVILRAVTIAFVLFWYILSLMYKIWMIKFEEQHIVYRNMVGMTKIIPYMAITSYKRRPDGKMIFYDGQQKVITVEREYVDKVLMIIARHSNIEQGKETDVKEFVMRPGRFYRGLSTFFMMVFISFFIFGIYARSLFATIVFFALIFFGIYNCVDQHKEYIIFKNNSIIHKRVLRKEKVILFQEIDHVERETDDNTEYCHIYTQDSKKPVLKINMYYENAALLQQLIVKYKW